MKTHSLSITFRNYDLSSFISIPYKDLIKFISIFNLIFIVSSFYFSFLIFKTLHFQGDKDVNPTFSHIIKKAVENSPIFHGKHRLILSMANNGMIKMAMNYLCSLKYANISSNYFILIATDPQTYLTLSPLSPSVVFYPSNLSQTAVNNKQIKKFYNFLHLRTRIAIEILKLGCDVITSDIDIVFLSDINSLFTYESDLEAQHDSKDIINPEHTNPPSWKLNLGFHLWHSSNVSIEMTKRILSMMLRMPKNHDQSVFRIMTKRLPMKWEPNSDVFSVDVSSLLGYKSNLRIKTINGLLAVNPGGVFIKNPKKWKNAAINAGLKKPILIHFFHLGSLQEKVYMAKIHGLWFEHHQKCLQKPPYGTNWPFWSN